jgi:predicted DNA-binding transcriptional regulator AlpA
VEKTVQAINADRLLTTSDAADHLSLGVHRLEKLRLSGGGPVFVKLGRSVRYERSALDAWIAASRRRSTSQEKA